MVHFIYFCMAVVAISFLAVPAFFGVNQAREELMAEASTQPGGAELTFKEIYELAAETENTDSPEFLNDIMPAAGEPEDFLEGALPSGFSKDGEAALEDSSNPIADSNTDPEPLN